MATEQFQVEGFDALFAAMDEMAEEIGKAKTDRIWRNALKVAFAPVLEAAKANAPRDTGQLADRMYMQVHRPNSGDRRSKYYVEGETFMARVSTSSLRDDSIATHVLNKRGVFQKVWRNRHPVALAQEFGTASTPQHPFLRPALEQNVGEVVTLLGTYLQFAIEEVARKAAKKG